MYESKPRSVMRFGAFIIPAFAVKMTDKTG